jgi:hypothetical protein
VATHLVVTLHSELVSGFLRRLKIDLTLKRFGDESVKNSEKEMV